VNENAFVSEVQTRPCPTFGRPVHLGLSPSITARYFSSCPSDSTSRWTPCPPEYIKRWLQVRLGCVQLSPSCPFRRLHTFRFLRPARLITLLDMTPSFERQRDFNPPEQRAAQRTLLVMPTTTAWACWLPTFPVTAYRQRCQLRWSRLRFMPNRSASGIRRRCSLD
jgi:hypothetical protein